MITRETKADDLPAMLRVSECAEWLDVGEAVVRQEIKSGRLRCILVGRLIRVPRSALAALAGTTQEGTR